MKKIALTFLLIGSILLCGCSDNSISSSSDPVDQDSAAVSDSADQDSAAVSNDDIISNPKNEVGNGYVWIRDEADFPAWVSEFRYADSNSVFDYWGKEIFSVAEHDLLFSCGVSAHKFENDLYGYIDLNGETVIEPKYSEARPFVNGSALVTENDERYYIDLNGNRCEDKTHEGYHGDFTKHYWYAPFTGKYLMYQDADMEHARVSYGYSDANGVDIDMPNVIKAYSFCNGFALVEAIDENQHIENYFIDEKFNRVTDFSYKKIESDIFAHRMVNTTIEGDLMLGLEYVYGDGFFVMNTGSVFEPEFELFKIVPELYQP